jgi:Domain of unknown function (DUF6268)
MGHSIAFRRIVALVVVVGVLGIARRAAAQDDRGTPGFGPNVSASSGAVPNADVGDSGQRYGYRDVGFGVSVPIKGGWDWDGQNLSGFRLMVHGGFHTDSAIIPYRSDRRDLYSTDVGVTAVHSLSAENQISWSAGEGFAEDNDTISSPKWRLSARVIAFHRVSEKLTLLYGGAYTFVLGRGRLLPMFGAVWRPNRGTSINVLGPISGRVHHRVGQRLVIGAQAGLRGGQYRVANNQQFSSASDNLLLRVREIRLGGEVGLILGRSLVLSGEAGIATARQVKLADGNTELFSSAVGPRPWASITLRVPFSKRPRWEGFDAAD